MNFKVHLIHQRYLLFLMFTMFFNNFMLILPLLILETKRIAINIDVVVFNKFNLPPGIYSYTLLTDDNCDTKKMIIK